MPSLRQFRRRFARHVGSGLIAGTATSGSTRSYLVDATRTSSLPIGDDRREWWLYRPEAATPADQLRLVDYVDLTLGHIHPDFPPGSQWVVAPANNEPYELLSPEFHPTEQIHDFVNEALRFCLVPSEVALTVTPGMSRQVLSVVHPWLTNASYLWQIGWLAAGENRSLADPYHRGLEGHVDYGNGDLALGTAFSFPSGPTTTLGAQLLAASLSMTVPSGAAAAFPPPPFTVGIESELVRVLTITAPTTWSVERAQHGTRAADHASGTTVTAYPLLFVRGLLPASVYCRPSGGRYGAQTGLTLDTDEALPDEQWVTAGALKEAWISAPEVMEQLSQRSRIFNLEQASAAFSRWQEVTQARSGLTRSFREVQPTRIGWP